MSRIWQEFYCGECDGYFNCKINMGIEYSVEITCPNCGHKHLRYIKKGQIFEKGRVGSMSIEELCPPKSAYHKKPITKKMQDADEKKSWQERRDGVIIEEDPPAKSMIRSLWAEKFGGRA